MRLIDADALIVEIKTCLWDWESVNGIMAKTVLNQTITDIGNMPTIDAVPVVRCEQCRYFEHNTCTKNGIRIGRYPDDFCSRGKEREECQHR